MHIVVGVLDNSLGGNLAVLTDLPRQKQAGTGKQLKLCLINVNLGQKPEK